MTFRNPNGGAGSRGLGSEGADRNDCDHVFNRKQLAELSESLWSRSLYFRL